MIKIKTQTLRDALNKAGAFSSELRIIPSFQMVKFMPTSRGLSLMTTNGEETCLAYLPADCTETRDFLVDVDSLAGALQGDDETVIELQQAKVKISSGKIKASAPLNFVNADDFPPANLPAKSMFQISGKLLGVIYGKVAFCAGDKRGDLRKYTVRISTDTNGEVVFEAVDGPRYGRFETKIKANSFNCYIRPDVLKKICDTFSESEEVNFFSSGGKLTFWDDDVTVNSTSVDGLFPDVSKLLATQYLSKLVIPKSSAKDAAKKTKSVSDKRIAGYGMTEIDFVEGEVFFSSLNEEAVISIGVGGSSNTPLNRPFNVSPACLVDGCSATIGEHVVIEISENPINMRMTDVDYPGWTYIAVGYKPNETKPIKRSQ